MYADWSSVQTEIQTESGHRSVLAQFPSSVGREVANTIVHSLAQSVARCNDSGDASSLTTDAEVQWTMQILCFGLTLPLSDSDTLRDCVSIYCDWMTCLLPEVKPSVPAPITEAPNEYVSTMLKHLYNIFVPRLDGAAELVSRQAVLCHRVLRTVQAIAEKSSTINSSVWDSMLRFLLAINDVLLAPPAERESIGSQLCERVLGVLFDIWIIACSRCFPAPSLWKTLQEMCSAWRHHDALVTQWHRVNVAFTTRLLRSLYPAMRITIPRGDDEVTCILDAMDHDRVVQCWFRFLHILGNPVELSRPYVITNTQQFIHASLTSDVPVALQSDCLRQLPTIFYRAMHSLSTIVDAFLGVMHKDLLDTDWLNSISNTRPLEPTLPPPVTPPSSRRPRPSIFPHPPAKVTKDVTVRPSASDTGSVLTLSSASTTNVDMSGLMSLSPCRPTVNSLLHLLGSWLLEASLVGVHVYGTDAKDVSPGAPGVAMEINYEAGRAQACGALCRIFCSHKTGEDVLPVYMSRFYISMYYALHIDSDVVGIPIVLSKVISNSSDLLRIDLSGVDIILPQLLTALTELQTRFKYKHDGVVADDDTELRRSSIHLLLSMICLPLHFGQMPIRAILDDTRTKSNLTFMSLKTHMTELLLQFLMAETDSSNTQMLLGGLVVCVLDEALWETVEQQQQQLQQSVVSSDQPKGSDLFDKAVSLVCNRLMMSWKTELNCALASMEVLSALARVKLSESSRAMCKRAVSWICDFVVSQCSRPAQYHSKDLHSMIVAAFQCLTTWLLEHDYLMQDKECLQTVLQVVELGISGSRSQSKPTEMARLKGDKDLKPVSMRVRDAADALLTTIVDYVGCFPPPCGPESLCSLLSEESLLKLSCGSVDCGCLPEGQQFQYYVIDGATIIGLLEQPLGTTDEVLPTITAIVRGAFGRHAWTMQLRHQSQQQKNQALTTRATTATAVATTTTTTTTTTAAAAATATVCNNSTVTATTTTTVPEITTTPHVLQQYFPDAVQQITPVLAEKSIPSLETTMFEHQVELEQLASLITSQVQFETAALENYNNTAPPATRCLEPSICQEFETVRLFLSHYGFLNLEGLKAGSLNSMPPSLVKLVADDHKELYDDLHQLDRLPIRTADVVSLYYVRTGQNKLADILTNVCHKQSVQPQFLEFVRSLGWPVDVQEHCGWTGCLTNSWKLHTDNTEDKVYLGETGGSLYDGQQQVLYWADVSSEVVFIVPSPTSHALAAVDKALPHAMSTDASLGSSQLDTQHVTRLKSLSLDLDNQSVASDSLTVTSDSSTVSGLSRLRRSGRTTTSLLGADVQVVVVWLESFEDHLTFPVGELNKASSVSVAEGRLQVSASAGLRSSVVSPQLCLIFIHALQNGLFRIKLQSQHTRIGDAVPLVDGMVVSRRLLGHLVRQTTVNVFKRRQLDSELFQPPHVRRKLKIKDVVEKYQCRLSEPDLYTSLFTQ